MAVDERRLHTTSGAVLKSVRPELEEFTPLGLLLDGYNYHGFLSELSRHTHAHTHTRTHARTHTHTQSVDGTLCQRLSNFTAASATCTTMMQAS